MYRSDKAAVLFRIEGESAASAISCLGDASVSSTMDIDSRNCIGSSIPQKTPMSMDWNMSFSGVADLTEKGVQERLFSAYKQGKRIQVAIIYRDTPVVDGYEGTVILSDWSVSLSAPGMAEVSFTGQGTSELFLVHDNALGVAVTIISATSELASGETVDVKKTPDAGTLAFQVAQTEGGEAIDGITINAQTGVVTFEESVANGRTFDVIVTLTAPDNNTATDKKTFTVVGQKTMARAKR